MTRSAELKTWQRIENVQIVHCTPEFLGGKSLVCETLKVISSECESKRNINDHAKNYIKKHQMHQPIPGAEGLPEPEAKDEEICMKGKCKNMTKLRGG
jgi:hypothetical protein